MKMKKTDDNMLIIKDITSEQFAVIKSWNKMVWKKATKTLEAPCEIELLDKLSALVKLPPRISAYRDELVKVQTAVDDMRIKENVTPIVQPPVKANLFQHQVRGYNMALINFTLRRGFGFLFEMGCGKTLTAIAVAGTLYAEHKINKLLVVAPTSVCSVWPEDFGKFADFPHLEKTMLGTKSQRLRQLKELESFPCEALKVAVINYESVWRDDIFDKLVEFNADMIICDESQRIKTHDAQQSKAMHKLGDLARYKLILSGTPVQNNAVDLYSQYRFLDPTVFGNNFYKFRNRFCVMGGFNKRQIVNYKDLDLLIKKEHSIAYRVTKKEALDLPEQTFETRYITLTPSEKKLYNTLKKESATELANGETISASTVLTKLLRLQQFTGGFVIADGEEKPRQIGSGKINALEDIVDDYVIDGGKKLVIFARFKAELDLIQNLLDKKKLKYGVIYGDIKLSDRGEIVKDFQENEETKVFLAQIDTAGLGITLTAADTCVYYSVNFNYAAYSQSLARIHRIGQRNTCTYIHLTTKGTVDELIMKALHKKEDLAKTIVDDWKIYFD
jgi:SNF2 family DNA or RNA helicase|nr:DEAD/DEAH box helicase [Ruminococcus sp. 1001270H_150608_F2]